MRRDRRSRTPDLGWCRRHRRSVTLDRGLRRLEAGPGDHLLGLRGAVEADDCRLAEHCFHGADGAHRVIADGSACSGPDVRGQPDPLADREWRRLLLLGARRSTGLRANRRSRRGGDDNGLDLLVLVLVLIVLILIVVVVVAVDGNDVVGDVRLGVIHEVRLDDVVGGLLLLGLVVGAGHGFTGVWGASGHELKTIPEWGRAAGARPWRIPVRPPARTRSGGRRAPAAMPVPRLTGCSHVQVA